MPERTDTMLAPLYSAADFRLRAMREENFIPHDDEDGDHRMVWDV